MIGERLTKQEAIDQLSMVRGALMADGASRRLERAFDMAVEAIEKEFDENAIKVGDECRYKASTRGYTFIVTYIDEDEGIFSALCTHDGDVVAEGTLSMIEKTGRHFESVERLLEEVRA